MLKTSLKFTIITLLDEDMEMCSVFKLLYITRTQYYHHVYHIKTQLHWQVSK
jgi:hypothetical protein